TPQAARIARFRNGKLGFLPSESRSASAKALDGKMRAGIERNDGSLSSGQAIPPSSKKRKKSVLAAARVVSARTEPASIIPKLEKVAIPRINARNASGKAPLGRQSNIK